MQWPWIVAMFTTAVLVQGQPQYEVQVKGPIDFEYRPGQENRLANGLCCTLEQGTSCFNSCDNQITLCFREVQHPSSDTNLAVCPLGRMVFTPPTMNTDIITLKATTALANTTTYPGSFQLLYSVIVTPGGNVVESNRVVLNLSIQNRTSPLTTLTFGAVRTVLSTGGIRVVCKEGYFGPDCGCTPQNNTNGVEEVTTLEPTTNSGPITINMIIPTVSSSIEGTDGGTVFTQKAYLSTSGNIFQPISTITIEHSSRMTRINTVDTTLGHISTTMQELVTTSTVSSNVSVTIPPMLTTMIKQHQISTASQSTTKVFVSNVDKTATIIPTPYTNNVMDTTFTTDPSSENSADIVLIVAGGVAGGLVVLLLILIVNIVLVIVEIKIKYTKHCSNKQGSSVEEHIELGANPLYEINRFAPSEQNDDYEVV